MLSFPLFPEPIPPVWKGYHSTAPGETFKTVFPRPEAPGRSCSRHCTPTEGLCGRGWWFCLFNGNLCSRHHRIVSMWWRGVSRVGDQDSRSVSFTEQGRVLNGNKASGTFIFSKCKTPSINKQTHRCNWWMVSHSKNMLKAKGLLLKHSRASWNVDMHWELTCYINWTFSLTTLKSLTSAVVNSKKKYILEKKLCKIACLNGRKTHFWSVMI